MIPLKALRHLADNGEPLHLSLVELKTHHFNLQAENRTSFVFRNYQNLPDTLDRIRSDFQHYPNEVTLNGEPVATTPFPDLCGIVLTSHHHHSAYFSTPETLNIETEYHLHHRMFVAGILIPTPQPGLPHSYMTPAPSPFSHWQPAKEVTLRPIPVVTREELQSLSDLELQLLIERNNFNPLTKTLDARDTEQIRRTMEHPYCPPEHTGPVYDYATSHPQEGSQPFAKGSPIIVHRTPVALSPEHLTNPEFISLAEALYTSDQELVPVRGGNHPAHTLTHISTTTVPPEAGDSGPAVQPVDSISIILSLDDQSEHTVQANLWMTLDEDFQDILNVFHIPGKLDQKYLADCLTRAYWSDDNTYSREDQEEKLAKLNSDMACVAKAAKGNVKEAYIEQLYNHLCRFYTNVPPPEEECIATSPDGSISLIYTPNTKLP